MTQDKAAIEFDLVYNSVGGLVLFMHHRDGKPDGASLTISPDGQSITLVRHATDTVTGPIKTDEARAALQKEAEITVIELDLETPENTLTYKLPIQK